MIVWDDEQQQARSWFESLRDRICAEFESIEREAGSDARFDYAPWDREDGDGAPGGGGVRGLMHGEVFEKVGVNVSTVGGSFNPEFARTIHGAAEDPRFFATGISLVAHMANPHVPAVHMNTRFLATTRRWFGGGADLNPPIPYDEDTADFHARLRAACAAHDQTYYDRFAKWAEEYFYIPHRGVHRGVGGIFYDHLECAAPGEGVPFEANLAFTREVGEAFLDIFPRLVRRRMATPFTAEDKARQLEWRGRYAEFNLIYDRGTLFGLKTGGNVDAILMSCLRRLRGAERHAPSTLCRRPRVPLPQARHGQGLMALIALRPDEVGAVVTYLEMRERPRLKPLPDSPLRIARWRDPDPAKYRLLFERVGARWLWFSRLAMDDSRLRLEMQEVHAVVDRAGIEVGLVELDFRQAEECLIRFLGLVPELAGRGHGRWLFAQTLALAWRPGIGRVHVNTCTLDHPAALPSYLKAGFRAYRRALESFPDPRLAGLLPREAAPQLPLFEHLGG